MSAAAPSVLYDAPGPRTRRLSRIVSIVAGVVLAGAFIWLIWALGQPRTSHTDAVPAKGVGGNDLRARRNVGAVYLQQDLGPIGIPQLGHDPRWDIIPLQHGAQGAIADQDIALFQRFEDTGFHLSSSDRRIRSRSRVCSPPRRWYQGETGVEVHAGVAGRTRVGRYNVGRSVSVAEDCGASVVVIVAVAVSVGWMATVAVAGAVSVGRMVAVAAEGAVAVGAGVGRMTVDVGAGEGSANGVFVGRTVGDAAVGGSVTVSCVGVDGAGVSVAVIVGASVSRT